MMRWRGAGGSERSCVLANRYEEEEWMVVRWVAACQAGAWMS